MSRQEGENPPVGGGVGEFSVNEAPGNLQAEFLLGLTFAVQSDWISPGQAGCVEDLLAKSSYRVSATEEECLFSSGNLLVRARRDLVGETRKLEMLYMAKMGTVPGRELMVDVFVDLKPVYRPVLSRFGIEMGIVSFQLSFPDEMRLNLAFAKGGVMVTLCKGSKAPDVAYAGGRWLNFIVQKKFAHYLSPAVVEIPVVVWLSLVGLIGRGELTGQTETEVAREIEKKLGQRAAFVGAVLGGGSSARGGSRQAGG